MNPVIITDLRKLRENIEFLTKKLKSRGLSITAVTKAHSATPEILNVYEEFEEIEYFGDSRIENLKSMNTRKKKVLIRIPMLSELKEVVKYADQSFHSEIVTLKELNGEAKGQNKKHEVVLMVDLGDLREGFFKKEELQEAAKLVMELDNLILKGIAVNLTCYGAIIPDSTNLSTLVSYAKELERTLSTSLPIVSGGNSSSLYLLDSKEDFLPEGITNLRIGESYLLGRETAFEKDYEEMHQDVFTIEAELIELKEKPSMPIGKIGVDAFGESPAFEDRGLMKRGILAIGKQDVSPGNLTPLDQRIKIVGGSSDHLLVDLTDTLEEYSVGDTLSFSISYGSLLSAFTSKYVTKKFITE